MSQVEREMIKEFSKIVKRRQDENMPINALSMFAEAWDSQQKIIDSMKENKGDK